MDQLIFSSIPEFPWFVYLQESVHLHRSSRNDDCYLMNQMSILSTIFWYTTCEDTTASPKSFECIMNQMAIGTWNSLSHHQDATIQPRKASALYNQMNFISHSPKIQPSLGVDDRRQSSNQYSIKQQNQNSAYWIKFQKFHILISSEIRKGNQINGRLEINISWDKGFQWEWRR